MRIVVPGTKGVTDTIDLERVAVIPAGTAGAERLTLPEKPLRLETVTGVELYWDP